MHDPARLLAFAVLTAAVSIVPGPNMLFVLGQSAWRRARGGALALAGMQIGNAGWFVLAGLGLGTLLEASPLAFRALTLGGAAYLAWLAVQAWRHAASPSVDPGQGPQRLSERPFRDGMLVAMSNPKSLVYVAALLPQFVDAREPIAVQLAILAVIGIAVDVAVGTAYILAGSRLAAAMTDPSWRRAVERGVAVTFMAIALGVLASAVR